MNTLFDQLSTLMRKIREIFDTVSDWVIDHRDWTILITSLAVATFFRLWKVIWPTDYLPAGLHPSEATVGLAANNIASGELVPLAVNELGSSVIFTYLQSLVALVANNGVLALRILPALISITAVVVVYFAAKSWFSKRAALIAMFFMASSAWATQIGRLGLDFSLAMLILPLIMWLLAIAIRTNQAKWYTLTGLALGLSLYIYPFSWIIPLTIVAILSYTWLVHKDKLKRMYKAIAIMLLAAVAILLPLLIYSLLERGLNFEVASISSMFSALISTLMMLHISGDSSAIYNLPRVAHLDAFSGILFILGLILAFIKWRNIRYMSLIILLGVTVLVATILRPELAPSATMMAPAIPIIYILVAVGLSDLLMRWKGVFPFNPIAWHIGAAVVVLAVATSTIYNYNRYFIAWANSPAAIEASYEHSYELAQYVLEDSSEDEDEASSYLVVAGSDSLTPIRYLLGDITDINYYSGSAEIDAGDYDVLLVVNNEVSIDLADELDVDVAEGEEYQSTLRVDKVLFYIL